jgi:N4-gp56 family major capsid protein
MAETSIAAGSAQAVKLMGVALFSQTQKKGGTLRGMTGGKPTQAEVEGKISKLQSDPAMPIVEIFDLSKSAGETVTMDCLDVVSANPIMGDRNAEGKGAPLSFSNMELSVNQWTFPVDAGGKMSQQRTPHELRSLAKASAVGLAARYFEQRNLVMLAGARGALNGQDWVIPLATSPDYAEIMINTVQAPTYNRHYVVDGNNIVQGGAQLASIDSTDLLKLVHIDALRNVIDNLDLTMQPVKLPQDMGGDNPMWVMFVPADVYSNLLTEGSLRTFQQNAVNRAQAGGMGQHPLFAGECGMWNGILVKKMHRSIRFNPSDTVKHVTSANAATATETDVTVNAGLTAGYAVNRCLLLGAQALACAYGKDSKSGYHYSWGEKFYNFERNAEFAVFGIEGSKKVRFNAPDANGNKIPTDHGVIVLDVAAKATAQS